MIPITILVMATLSPLVGLGLLVVGYALFSTRKEANRWRQLAFTDQLTCIPNRRGLEDHWRTMDGPKALILIDLVGFKAVNDNHGHIVGDALLQQVARRLAASIASPGILARWGGDEFAALVPAHRLDLQKQLIHNAKQAVYDLSESGGPRDVHISARLGYSLNCTDIESAVRLAAQDLSDNRD